MPAPIWFPASFSPEQVQTLTQAYELACTKLGLELRDDPANEMVAKEVLLYRDHETDPVRICEMVVAALAHLEIRRLT
jgi:hypothetical protein